MARQSLNFQPGLAAVFLALALAACGEGSNSTPGQVLAKVNGKEITSAQFNEAIRQVVGDRESATLRRDVLEQLVDRELAVQRALADKLDRRPEVLLEIEEARRNMLARAFALQASRTPEGAVTEDKAAKYFAEHPEVYAQRKIFLLRIHAWPSNMKESAEIRQRVAAGQKVGEIVDWLTAQKVAYTQQVVIRPAEQVPMVIVKKLSQAQTGEAVILEHPDGVLAYQVVASESAPRLWAEAKQDVLATLAQESRSVVLAERLRGLRTESKIEYLGEFAPVK
jgi:EpsD family peptidyl-prolyl cis-trans isomerase